jgi:AraC family transcriptional regulator of adaptative response/methylated-DNA-[protein]-cysteine methyltransferase
MMEASMLSPDRLTDLTPLADAVADYDVVRRAIGHIRGHWREQPEIEAIAEAAGVTPTELHHLFRRWAGITPKAFLQALTLDSARQLLRDSASVLDATYEVGLSGPRSIRRRSAMRWSWRPSAGSPGWPLPIPAPRKRRSRK